MSSVIATHLRDGNCRQLFDMPLSVYPGKAPSAACILFPIKARLPLTAKVSLRTRIIHYSSLCAELFLNHPNDIHVILLVIALDNLVDDFSFYHLVVVPIPIKDTNIINGPQFAA